MKTVAPTQFMGFPAKRANGNFWCYPKVVCLHWHELVGSEQKVLDCVLRHTWGFDRSKDRISLTQLENGVGQIHHGVGLSKKQIIRALHSLETKGFITSVKSTHTNEYSLVTEVHQEQGTKVNQGSVLTSPATGDKSIQAGSVETTHTIDSDIEKFIKKLYKTHSQYFHPGKKLPLTNQARENIRARLNEYHHFQLYTAIRNANEDDYWKPIAEKNTSAWFFDSEERIATFLALGPYEWSPEEKSDISAP